VEKKYKNVSNGRKKDVADIYRDLYVDVMQTREDIEISTLPLKKSVCTYLNIQLKYACFSSIGSNKMLMSS
jgi:hypothetical protein